MTETTQYDATGGGRDASKRLRIGPAGVLGYLTDTRHWPVVFAAGLFLVYCIVPAWLGSAYSSPYMLNLAGMAAVAAASIIAGFYLPILDFQFGAHRFAITVDARWLHIAIWGAFAIFCVVAFATAGSAPLFSALRGGVTEAVLDQERAAFLKMREGWGAGLGYLSGIFTGALLPYSLSSLLVRRARGRYGALAVFLLYAESFLQKALFLQVLIPIFYLVVQRKLWNLIAFSVPLALTLLLLFGNARLVQGELLPALPDFSHGIGQGTSHGGPGAYFNAHYDAKSSLGKLVWRAVAVPVFTARDAIEVFDEVFDGKQLRGATSSFVAKIFRLERVNYDLVVYDYEWGNGALGRSNTVYFIEGFVNFGWVGVVLFSLIVGQCYRILHKSGEDALKAMSLVLGYNLIQASLMGTMLSGGFILVFLIALFVTVKWPKPSNDQTAVA